ncbi:MAG: hypothetical protein U0U70_12380 [Chitinophagaceae bacterium]
MQVITVIFLILLCYLAIGLLFAIAFVIKGAARIDETAKGSGWGFRLIIIPGSVIFWPFLLRKWIQAVKHHRHD